MNMRRWLSLICVMCLLAGSVAAAEPQAGARSAGKKHTIVNQLPPLFTRRTLSDEEIAALKNAEMEELRRKIATPADFAAWVETVDAPYYCGVSSNERGQRAYGLDHALAWYRQMFTSAMAATLAMYMLQDDIPGMGVVAASMGFGEWLISGNVIPAEDGGCYVFSLDSMSGKYQSASGVSPESFPLVRVKELSDIQSYLESADDPVSGAGLTQVFLIETLEQVALDIIEGVFVPQDPELVTEIYRSPDCDEPLPATTPLYTEIPEGLSYTVIDELPGWITERRLSDADIAAQKTASRSKRRQQIATPADLAAWIDQQGGAYFSNVTSNSRGQRTYGPEHAYLYCESMMSSSLAASVAMHMLGDDFPGIGILVAYMDCGDGVVMSGSVIPADGGYYVFSLDTLSKKQREARGGGQETFPLVFVKDLADMMAFCGSDDNRACMGGRLRQLLYIETSRTVVLDYRGGYFCPREAEYVTEIYRSPEALKLENRYDSEHIRPENIQRYALSKLLGGVTLSAEEAYALLKMQPEQVKKRVKTAGDVLMLMLAGQYGDLGGDRTKLIKGVTWHYNNTAFDVMKNRLTNCGSAANLVNYLLEGDYDEVGFIAHAYYIGEEGGHVYNYFLYEGKYYIVDFSYYMFGYYLPSRDYPVTVVDRLEDYVDHAYDIYGDISCIIAHTSKGQHLPCVFDDENKAYGVPQGANYTVLYQERGSNRYQVKEYPLDRSKLDWTKFK